MIVSVSDAISIDAFISHHCPQDLGARRQLAEKAGAYGDKRRSRIFRRITTPWTGSGMYFTRPRNNNFTIAHRRASTRSGRAASCLMA